MSIGSEAGMYAATYRFMTWMMILATTIAVGCRGAQKFGRQVQVSESSDVELAELDHLSSGLQLLCVQKVRENSLAARI